MIPIGKLDPIHTDPPDWAIGKAEMSTELGAQLPTKDGRRCGNAVVYLCDNNGTFHIITDAGTTMVLNAAEIDELFHPAVWCMKTERAPGFVQKRVVKDPVVQALIDSQQDGYWQQHPDFDDWLYEVRNEDTRQGFWEWLAIKEGLVEN